MYLRSSVTSSKLSVGCRLGLLGLAAALGGLPWKGQAALRLNEIVAVNQVGLPDDRGGRPDWIELHNPTDAQVDLSGWGLSDDPSRPRRWVFQSAAIPPGGFLVVYASGEDRQPSATLPLGPSEVPGLVGWYRADDLLSDPRTSLRPGPGGSFVRSWPDASGRGAALEQALPARQPILNPGSPAAVRFDGVDDFLRFPRAWATNSFTVLCVVAPSGAHEIDEESSAGVGGVSGQRWLFGANHGGDLDAGMGLSAGTNGLSVYEHGSGYMPALAVMARPFATPAEIVSVVYDEKRVLTAVAGLSGPVRGPSPRRQVFAPTDLGAGAYGAFAGEVREIVIFDRPLSDAERRGVELGLAERHGLTLATAFHTNFRLDGDGETLVLTRPDGQVEDRVRYPALPRDVAWGRPPTLPDQWVFFAEPTPGTANTTVPSGTTLAAPQFSVSPGFYSTPFSLVLSSSDAEAEIRYTLDGSEPVETSPRYVDAVGILNRTTQPNRASAISTAPSWRAPAGLVFKGTVVRARAFRTNSVPSETVTGTYFVHPAARDRYPLPVVALTTASSNLFDADRGIYVPGKAPGGNYAQTGDAWERPVFVEFYETNGVRAIAAESGLRIHGNTSFQFPIKGLRLHALNQKGTGPFEHRIFPDRDTDRFSRLLLRPSGHDYNLTLMRDGMMQTVASETGLDVQAYRPAVVFINGEYWGIHNLQEAIERNYFAAHHPEVDPNALDYLEGYPPGMFVYEGAADGYTEMIQHLETHGAADAASLDWAGARMDLRNFQDYKIAEIFYVRWDIGNHRVWRPHTPGALFRWVLFDCDVGFGGFWSEPNAWSFDMLRAVLEPSGSLHGHNNGTTVFLLRTLLDNPKFRSEFILRFADLMNTTYETSRVVGIIDRMAAEIAPQIQEHTDRWRAPSSVREWQTQVEALRAFAKSRPAAMRQHLSAYFNLPGWVQLRLQRDSPEGGTVECHSIAPLVGLERSWSGSYPAQQTITLRALPHPGWRFEGWSELPGVTDATLAVALQSDTVLTARFAPLAPPRVTGVRRISAQGIAITSQVAAGASVTVETSPDLLHWTTLGQYSATPEGEVAWTSDVGRERLFFRIRLLP
ncbi:MAG: CotH kinase family protein [Verrucomicrobiales bacterium]|nr:CotH kinase family protein [Verrucomicrobiales bacterium]